MAFTNPNNFVVQNLSEKDLTYKYWYEFLYPMVLSMWLEIPNEILDKNYDFFKLCENFTLSNLDLKTYLQLKWYENILFLNETNFKLYLNKNFTEINTWMYNFAFKNWVYVVALKCNYPRNIIIDDKTGKFSLGISDIIWNT